MKDLLYILLLAFPILVMAQSPSQNQNYVMSNTYQKGYVKGQEQNATTAEKITSISYFDGLGRPIQSVGVNAGGQSQDIITFIGYDALGRQTKEYLPYTSTTNGGGFRTNALNATYSFYDASKYEADFPGMSTSTINPYSEKHFEVSSLNRVLEQTAPGSSWKIGSTFDSNGHSNGYSIKFGYHTNTATDVKKYDVTTVLSGDVYVPTLNGGTSDYAVGELYKTITKDENWKPTLPAAELKNHTTEEFKDKQGRVILKRTYATISGTATAHDTYYVYDDYGNLTYVLPPKSEADVNKPNSTELLELCYQYKHDTRNRLVEKKIPGKDWEYIVYDNLDRPVLIQDANQRAKSTTSDEWLVTKYDVLGRVIYTGIYTTSNGTTRGSIQTTFNNKTAAQNYETKVTSGSGYGGSYYTNSDYPVIASSNDILTINYYDNYYFNKDGLSLPSSYEGQSIINYNNASSTQKLTKSLATGSKVKVLDTTYWITTLTGYDAKGRTIYVTTKNPYLQTTDIVKSKLDFVGKADKIVTTHSKTGKATITTTDNFEYDHAGRLLTQKQTVNNEDEEFIVNNTYDDFGQLVSKGVGNVATSGTRLQTANYTYNIRGWLKGINNTSGSNSSITLGTGDIFGFQINYDNPTDATKKLYNGNISQSLWKTTSLNPNPPNNLVSNKYTYTYDALNRIISAMDNTGRYDVYGIVYDKNGNIKNLKRDGKTHATNNTFGLMDNLTYTYHNGDISNRLLKVEDASNITEGFKNGSTTTTEYEYDSNGNMFKDLNKGITNITYNHLNLPTQVTIGGQNISYIYDATGVKLSKTVSGTTTDYAGNYVYENNNLQFFNHAEGYVTPSGSSFKYVYQYKDHLGNIRLSYSDTDGNGTIATSEIIEENNYYPFGLKHRGYNTNVSSNGNSVAQKRKFGGNELQDELGLEWYDITARNYDPALGRWMNLDPLAEQMRRHSPYNYAFDNPIYFIDPDGMKPGPGDWLRRKASQAKKAIKRAVYKEVKRRVVRAVNKVKENVANSVEAIKVVSKEAVKDFITHNSPGFNVDGTGGGDRAGEGEGKGSTSHSVTVDENSINPVNTIIKKGGDLLTTTDDSDNSSSTTETTGDASGASIETVNTDGEVEKSGLITIEHYPTAKMIDINNPVTYEQFKIDSADYMDSPFVNRPDSVTFKTKQQLEEDKKKGL